MKNKHLPVIVLVRILMLAWGAVIVLFAIMEGADFWLLPMVLVYFVLYFLLIYLVKRNKNSEKQERGVVALSHDKNDN